METSPSPASHSRFVRIAPVFTLLVLNPIPVLAEEAPQDRIEVTASRTPAGSAGVSEAAETELADQRASSSDSAQLLQNSPGVSLYGAGGVSGLPVIHGLGDDRLRVQVNGMDLMSACPNHMNSPLSYIDPTRVSRITVYYGVTPVSVGGDSIGGTIQVNSAPPEFALPGQTLTKGALGGFYRSNGEATGENVSLTAASESLNLTYSGSAAKSGNYQAGRDFKAAGPGASGGKWLSGSTVGSTAYDTKNDNLGLAWKRDQDLWQLDVGRQLISFEGFPNQRMDMTGNDSTQTSLRYSGGYAWGKLEGRGYFQDTHHEMNMGPDRFTYGALGMPMLTKAQTAGFTVQAETNLSDRDLVRSGIEYQDYTLYDWWPQAGGMMGPSTFWNIDYGVRSHIDAYTEWEAMWNTEWVTLLGVRASEVKTESGPVQGYNAAPIWSADAAAFNAGDRNRTDNNWDMTASAHYTPGAEQEYEVGYSRKTRSPNLYQRYAWSTQPMATLMNNFVGDGNGYIGNLDLKPEVAHTFSVTGNWHDGEASQWRLLVTAYYTYVSDYIDARRCDFGQCGGAQNVNATTGFVNLQYVNQSARIYGLDVSGQRLLGRGESCGEFSVNGLFNYVRGVNATTDDNLYDIMPPNAKVTVQQDVGQWKNSIEVQFVAAKTLVSQVRNEVPTPAYELVNWRTNYKWKQASVDFGIDNLLNRFYEPPLGGAYVGQGASMGINNIPWGVPVPGKGRSVNVAVNVSF